MDPERAVGLVGIGLVGTAIAENLLANGFVVLGFARREVKRREFERLGGQPVESLGEVARSASRVVLSLTDSDAVEEVVLGPGGLLEAASALRVIIDTTTGEPDRTEVLARRLSDRGIRLIDAPISGSSEQIRNRQGVVLIGGERTAYESCLDLIQVLSQKHYYLGSPGAGSRAKLASNLILGLNRLVLAEGLVFAERLGLDLETFLAMARTTPAYSAAMDVKGEKMLRGDFTPQSRITQHHKDLLIILEYADRLELELPLTRLHKKILKQCITAGEGDLDTSAVIREFRRMGIPDKRQ
jgi:3-hydroxyisobutyrate dehydrogenase-like beta-hydroxyacid dehydrogenase